MKTETAESYTTAYTKRDLQTLIDWLDDHARSVSNLKKPRSDNNYGRAAQALADLIEPWSNT